MTHFCEECGSGATGLSGHYCAEHAVRHDRLVLERFAPVLPDGPDRRYAILAKPISDKEQLS